MVLNFGDITPADSIYKLICANLNCLYILSSLLTTWILITIVRPLCRQTDILLLLSWPLILLLSHHLIKHHHLLRRHHHWIIHHSHRKSLIFLLSILIHVITEHHIWHKLHLLLKCIRSHHRIKHWHLRLRVWGIRLAWRLRSHHWSSIEGE